MGKELVKQNIGLDTDIEAKTTQYLLQISKSFKTEFSPDSCTITLLVWTCALPRVINLRNPSSELMRRFRRRS